ncbi:uncharacterized protein P884DRAFT_250811 [Thermothelomyces heterothallicus CBS 202.75]|uniref:uncharacterized protein n=1 Tax=Thermothelomyces heterothallicus CBS 202.75 TaxID=1149848 RepID=UPI00374252DF
MAAASPSAPDIVDTDKGPTILATTIAVTVLSTLFVGARLFTRIYLLGKMHLDDYFMIVAMLCSWATVAITSKAVQSGSGHHAALLTDDQLGGAIFYTMVAFCPGILSFGLPKLAVVALLTRMMNPSRLHSIFLWFLAIFCQLSLMGCVGILFGQCTPTRSMWDFSVKGKCINPWILVNYSIYAGSFSGFVDLYFAVYPSIVLLKLQMSLKKKIALSFALGIGSVAGIVAIYKCTRLPGLASPDFVYDTADLTIWTAIEGSTIMIAASIPILKPLADYVVGRRTFSSSNSYNRYEKHPGSRSGHMASDMELSSGRGFRRGGGPKDPMAISQLDTVVDSGSCEEGRKSDGHDSQTNIVSRVDDYTSPQSRPALPPKGAIVRTDHVAVTTTYGTEASPAVRSMDRWK